MTLVVPAKLASKCFQPSSGKEENLNPVILLHGITLSKESFDNIPQAIADGTNRKVYALDARNHGDSEYSDVFSFDINVDDLFHFMDTTGIEKAVLVGHSMGGITAINAALRKPEKIEMIFVEDIHSKKIPKEEFKKLAGFIQIWPECVRSVPKGVSYTEAMKHACDILYENLPPDTPGLPPKEVFCKNIFPFRQTTEGSYELKFNQEVLYKACKDAENIMSEPSGQYDGPAYFLYGTLSELRVWEEEEHIKKHFPNAELIKFEGATHDVHALFPELFTTTILQRLKH